MGTITTSGLYTAPGHPGSHTVTATSNALPSYSVNASVTVTNQSGSVPVLTYHNDDVRDGVSANKTVLNPSCIAICEW